MNSPGFPPPMTGFSKSHSSPHCFSSFPSLDISFLSAFKGSSFSSFSTCSFWIVWFFSLWCQFRMEIEKIVKGRIQDKCSSDYILIRVRLTDADAPSTTFKTSSKEALFTCLVSHKGDEMRRQETLKRKGNGVPLYQGVPKVYQGVHKVYQGVPRCTKVYQGVPRCTQGAPKLYQGVPKVYQVPHTYKIRQVPAWWAIRERRWEGRIRWKEKAKQVSASFVCTLPSQKLSNKSKANAFWC